jgi:hypothetical protein
MQQVRIVRISFCSNIFGIIFDRNLCRPNLKKPEDLFYGMIECAEFATIVVTLGLVCSSQGRIFMFCFGSMRGTDVFITEEYRPMG